MTSSSTLEPTFRHDYTVWRSTDRAPKGYPIQHVQLLMTNNTVIKNAHYACGGGEEQDFFSGWFTPVIRADGSISYYSGVDGRDIIAWAPMNLTQPTL